MNNEVNLSKRAVMPNLNYISGGDGEKCQKPQSSQPPEPPPKNMYCQPCTINPIASCCFFEYPCALFYKYRVWLIFILR
jgi:hypothetical protein